jgi:hypothetical protein
MFIQLILILPPLLGLAFLLWMAWDLGGNDNLSSSEKTYWMWAFLFMNVFAAGFYYATEYRKRH